MTPSGIRTLRISSPFGRCQDLTICPTGSAKFLTSRRLSAISRIVEEDVTKYAVFISDIVEEGEDVTDVNPLIVSQALFDMSLMHISQSVGWIQQLTINGLYLFPGKLNNLRLFTEDQPQYPGVYFKVPSEYFRRYENNVFLPLSVERINARMPEDYRLYWQQVHSSTDEWDSLHHDARRLLIADQAGFLMHIPASLIETELTAASLRIFLQPQVENHYQQAEYE